MAEIRHFTDADWQGLSGAMRFEQEGVDPLIASLDIADGILVVGDATGIQIIHNCDRGSLWNDEWWSLKLVAHSFVIQAVMEKLIVETPTFSITDRNLLACIGFDRS